MGPAMEIQCTVQPQGGDVYKGSITKKSLGKDTGSAAILQNLSGGKQNKKKKGGGKGLGQQIVSNELGATLNGGGGKTPVFVPFKKGDQEKLSSKNLAVDTNTNKDPVQVLSKIIVDALTPDHIKYAKEGSPLKAQQKLYENIFHITGPSQYISLGKSTREIVVHVTNAFDAERIKSLSLLNQLDYDTYKIDKIIVEKDYLKAQKKLNFVQKKMEAEKNNNKKGNNKKLKKNQDEIKDNLEYYNMIGLGDPTNLDDSVDSTGLDDLVVVYSSSTDQENIINEDEDNNKDQNKVYSDLHEAYSEDVKKLEKNQRDILSIIDEINPGILHNQECNNEIKTILEDASNGVLLLDQTDEK